MDLGSKQITALCSIRFWTNGNTNQTNKIFKERIEGENDSKTRRNQNVSYLAEFRAAKSPPAAEVVEASPPAEVREAGLD